MLEISNPFLNNYTVDFLRYNVKNAIDSMLFRQKLNVF
jgi:hypothetical protein